jgi:hypothetical protein
MMQFAFHVQRRLLDKPSTVNFFHSTLPDKSYDWFQPKSLLTGIALDKAQAKRLADELKADPNALIRDAHDFTLTAPYGLNLGADIFLQHGAPNTSFTKFLKTAIHHHEPKVITSLRKGSDKMTGPSFYVAYWISKYVISRYFDVRFLIIYFLIPSINLIHSHKDLL